MGPQTQSFRPKINCIHMKLPDFESPSGDSLPKVPILDFQSEFSMSKIIRVFFLQNREKSKYRFLTFLPVT